MATARMGSLNRAWATITRDQFWVLLSLAGVTILAWLYLLRIASEMPAMDMVDAMMTAHPQGGPAQMGLSAVMWAVMMVGMMLPGALPMILLFAAVQKRHAVRPHLAVAVFVAGYLLVWGGFSLLAATLQMLLTNAMFLTPSLSLPSSWSSGLLLLAAGFYELSPLKERCLSLCRGPVSFIAAYWRPGVTGAFRMGLRHGAYCVGCCWALMLLLFVGGVMNLLWVAVLAAVVLAQKLFPRSATQTRTAGLLLCASGLTLISHSLGQSLPQGTGS